MRRLAMGAIALTAVMGLAAGALAQGCGTGDIPLGDIYLSFAPDMYDRYVGSENAPGGDPSDTQIPAFSPFTFYLVASIDYCECGDCGQNFNRGITAWEAQLDLAAAADITIIGTTLSPAGSTNFGAPANTNFLVGTGGGCVRGDDSPFALVTFQGLIGNALGATDQRIDIIPAAPASRFSPAWNQCSPPDGILYPFYANSDFTKDTRGYENGYIVINPVVTVGTENSTWGALKADFTGE